MSNDDVQPRNRAERRGAGRKTRAAGAAITAGAAALSMGAAWVGTGVQSAGAATTFTVTSATDDGTGDPGTLSEAINDANATAGADVIDFSVPGGVIDITGDLPSITEDLTITGPGAAALTVDGQDANSLFYFTSAVANATVSGLTITNGSAAGDGGAILSGADNLTLDGLVLSSNTAADAGGGVAAWGSGALVVTNSTFIDNVSPDMGGGLYTNNQASIVISGSTFDHNESVDSSGGGISVDTAGGPVSITDSTIVGNLADNAGGLYLDDIDGILTLTGVAITDNEATAFGGGGLSIFDTNEALVLQSTISGNEAGYGGGLYSNVDDDESVTLESSTITGNLANDGWGGGLYLQGDGSTGSLAVRNSTFDHNTAVEGGAGLSLYNVGTPTSITNSTISTNTAQGSGGGGILMVGLYGLDLVQSTVTANTAPAAAGLEIVNVQAGSLRAQSNEGHRGGRDDGETRVGATALGDGHVNITGSIVAGNNGDDLGDDTGTAIADHALIGVVAVGFQVTDAGGSIFGVDPMLGPLASNGGPTQTHALLLGSPAIDKGPVPVPIFPGNEFDQRGAGFARVVAGTVDIGAFEVQPPPVVIQPRFTG